MGEAVGGVAFFERQTSTPGVRLNSVEALFAEDLLGDLGHLTVAPELLLHLTVVNVVRDPMMLEPHRRVRRVEDKAASPFDGPLVPPISAWPLATASTASKNDSFNEDRRTPSPSSLLTVALLSENHKCDTVAPSCRNEGKQSCS